MLLLSANNTKICSYTGKPRAKKRRSEPGLLACLPLRKAQPGKKSGGDKEDDSAKGGKRCRKRNCGESDEYYSDQDKYVTITFTL